MALGGVSPVVQYTTAIKDEQKAADTYVKTDPLTKRNAEDFRKSAASITSTTALMKNYAANQVVLGAYNLQSVATQAALETKLLNENPYNSGSTAGKSHNATWTKFADAFYKMSTTDVTMEDLPELDTTTPILSDKFKISSGFIDQLVQDYKYNLYENGAVSAGGVGDALYFTRQLKSGSVRSIDDILKDPKLLNVVERNFSIDADQFDKLSFSAQREKLSETLNITKFNGTDGKVDPDKVADFAEIYIQKSTSLEGGTADKAKGYIAQYQDLLTTEQNKADGYVMGDNDASQAISHFTDKGTSIQSVNDLLSDSLANKVVLGAFNLDSLANDPARERKLLLENPYQADSTVAHEAETNNSSGARALADSFYNIKVTTGTQDMKSDVDKTSRKLSGGLLLSSDFVDKTVDSYEIRQYETSKDMNKSGVGNALYFTRTMMGGKITSVNALMSDPTLLKVVEVVNGLNPDDIGSLDFKQQQTLVKRLFNVNDFTKPNPDAKAEDGSDARIPDEKKIQKYAERYLAMLQIHPEFNSVDEPANILDLFGGSSDEDGIVALFA